MEKGPEKCRKLHLLLMDLGTWLAKECVQAE